MSDEPEYNCPPRCQNCGVCHRGECNPATVRCPHGNRPTGNWCGCPPDAKWEAWLICCGQAFVADTSEIALAAFEKWAQDDELFTIPETKPDALTLARNRLEKSSAAYDLAIAESERAEIALIDTRADWLEDMREVAKLETERLKGAK